METMKQACKLMYQENIGSIVILTRNTDSHNSKRIGTTHKNEEIPVGIVMERDIARIIGFSAKFFADMNVSEIMSKPLITVTPTPNTSVKDAMALMDQKNIRRLPVVDYKGQMVDIITRKDIFKAVINLFKGKSERPEFEV